jgi:hypothetical protein
MLEYRVTNIDYDTNDIKGLPVSLDIKVPFEIMEEGEESIDYFISDEISDLTGFCHYGYNRTTINN